MIAQDIMTQDPMTVGPTVKLRDALQILQTLEIRHLPVVDRTTLVGMISDRDLRAGRSSDTPVTELMSADVLSASPETSVREVIDMMLEHKVGALPVVDDSTGDLVGIISYVDVLRALRDTIE